MSSTIPMIRASDTGEGFFAELSPEQKKIAVLEQHYPQLCNDIAMLIRKPFRLNWDWLNLTASTDCQATINLSPWFFLDGKVEVGFGSAYHECGHINHSPYGLELLQAVQRERDGGATLEYVAQIVLDRKDDMRTAEDAPGFADTLRRRLDYICTLGRREELARRTNLGPDEREVILGHVRPRDVYEDFFFAAKWHRRARFKATHKALKYLNRRHLRNASLAKMLWIIKKVWTILAKAAGPDHARAEYRLSLHMTLAKLASHRALGRTLDPRVMAAIIAMMKRYVRVGRTSARAKLIERLKAAPVMHPGPLSTGSVATVPVEEILPAAQYAARYQKLLASIQSWVEPLIRKLRRLDSPSEYSLYGQDEGDIDFSEVARIATGLRGFREKIVTVRDINAEIHLAFDCSGSMSGEKLESAKKIGTAFCEAILTMQHNISGRLWGYNSLRIWDFGPPHRSSAFVSLESGAGNSDTHMLAIAGKALANSTKRRRVLLMLCDDGPDNMEKARELSHQLLARGIVVVHLLVGVHGTPHIFPFELVYTSMDECLEEFGDLLIEIIRNLR